MFDFYVKDWRNTVYEKRFFALWITAKALMWLGAVLLLIDFIYRMLSNKEFAFMYLVAELLIGIVFYVLSVIGNKHKLVLLEKV